ncbi:MAG TPA: DUF6647 family protein [Burkholderiales bacterium]|nr:DUF6647 family protein [Burkholderiales bacterium]
MVRVRFIVVLLLCSVATPNVPASAQVAAPAEPFSATDELEPVLRSLFAAISLLSDYQAPETLPPVFQVPQPLIEAKICDDPCSVSAAYVPREGVFLAENLDPVDEPWDRSVLLHELVHSLQQGHPKFARLTGCERERAKEEEAYAIQNAYLAMIGAAQRAVFYDGEFECGGVESAHSP